MSQAVAQLRVIDPSPDNSAIARVIQILENAIPLEAVMEEEE